MTKEIYLGVDGGGTKTAFILENFQFKTYKNAIKK